MRVASEVRLGLFALALLQLITAFAAIGLLTRMSPAVEQILLENVYSMEAVDDMLLVLAGEGDAKAFEDALQRATNNVTEREETSLLTTIQARYPAALAGNDSDRVAVARSLTQLAAVNRASMDRADHEARTLGWAGAWAIVLLGFASFVVILLVVRRQESRLVQPIVELHAAVERAVSGDPHRRCIAQPGPLELQRLASDLNRLLDERFGTTSTEIEDPQSQARQELLNLLLDRLPGAAVAGTPSGDVLAFRARDLRSPPKAIANAVRAGSVPEGWSVEHTPHGAWLAQHGVDPRGLPLV